MGKVEKEFSKLRTLLADETPNIIPSLEEGKFPNLNVLDIRKTNIEDASWLANYHLIEELDVGHNRITDASFLSEIKQLRILYIPRNNNLKVPSLSDHTKLDEVVIGYNGLTNASVFKNSSINRLNILGNNISDLSPLSENKNMAQLLAKENPIKVCPSNTKSPGLNDFCKARSQNKAH